MGVCNPPMPLSSIFCRVYLSSQCSRFSKHWTISSTFYVLLRCKHYSCKDILDSCFRACRLLRCICLLDCFWNNHASCVFFCPWYFSKKMGFWLLIFRRKVTRKVVFYEVKWGFQQPLGLQNTIFRGSRGTLSKYRGIPRNFNKYLIFKGNPWYF